MKDEPTQIFTQIMHNLPLKFEGKKKGGKRPGDFSDFLFFLIQMSVFLLKKKKIKKQSSSDFVTIKINSKKGDSDKLPDF